MSMTELLRALVMVACLVLLPLYAVVGTSLPQKAMPLIDRFWKSKQPDSDRATAATPQSGTSRPPQLLPVQRAAHLAAQPLRSPVTQPTTPPTARQVSFQTPNQQSRQTGATWPQRPGAVISRSVSPIRPAAYYADDPAQAGPSFAELENRLSRLGVSSYSLEMELLGGGQRRYWCSCKVPNRFGRFEASAAGAIPALAKVVDQVQAWKAAHIARLE